MKEPPMSKEIIMTEADRHAANTVLTAIIAAGYIDVDPSDNIVITEAGAVDKLAEAFAAARESAYNAGHAAAIAHYSHLWGPCCDALGGGIVDCTGPEPVARKVGTHSNGTSVKLPITADNVLVMPYMSVVWHPAYDWGGDVEVANEGTHCIGVFYRTGKHRSQEVTEYHISECYSTREAAEQAAKDNAATGEKENTNGK